MVFKISACILAVLVAVIAVFHALWNRSAPSSDLLQETIVSSGRAAVPEGLFDGQNGDVGVPPPESTADPEISVPSLEPPLAAPQGDDSAALPSSPLQLDFYQHSCPQAERIVRASIKRIYAKQPDIAPGLLRLFFHDCFIMGCDASVLLDDSDGNRSHPIERRAGPNLSLRGLDEIDQIKSEIERTCPGVVSCADILALATRDAILLTGGPFYPIFTGRRDSLQSYPSEANAQIPKPDANITETLTLFSLRGFGIIETVSLLGGHNIGKITCTLAQGRLSNFKGTGLPDATLDLVFAEELRRVCGTEQSSNRTFPLGKKLDNHYYKNIMAGRGVLFADQQLLENEGSAAYVESFADDDGQTFRRSFARAMVQMSMLGVLTGGEGEVRKNCSSPLRKS